VGYAEQIGKVTGVYGHDKLKLAVQAANLFARRYGITLDEDELVIAIESFLGRLETAVFEEVESWLE